MAFVVHRDPRLPPDHRDDAAQPVGAHPFAGGGYGRVSPPQLAGGDLEVGGMHAHDDGAPAGPKCRGQL